jgi:hypothetical protein
MECDLGDLEANLKLAILPRHLRIVTLGHPPLLEVMVGVIAVVRVREVYR